MKMSLEIKTINHFAVPDFDENVFENFTKH